ncbi:hypothetical protein M3Y95_01241500 [Aphelenchoides besseyi]|nr:hypothetical protein M3Y95_01241500 [Aphelenchoides besseyi]
MEKRKRSRRGSLVVPIDHNSHLTTRKDFFKVERDDGPSFNRFLRSYTRNFVSFRRFADSFLGLIPPIRWLPNYSIKRQLPGDLFGGTVLTFFNIPLGIACSNLAGVPLVNGLYTMLFAAFFYPIFSNWPHGSMGPFASIDIATGEHARMVMSHYYADLSNITDTKLFQVVNPTTITSAMVFLNGLVCIAFGLLRLDFVAEYFSEPLVGGFTTGVALYVVVSQIAPMLGIQKPPKVHVGYQFPNLWNLARRLDETNLVTVLISTLSIVLLLVCKSIVQPQLQRHFKSSFVVLPWEFILLVVSTSLSWFLQINRTYDVYVVGSIPKGLPLPQLPNLSLLPDLFLSSLAISIVQICTHMFAAKVLSRRVGYRVDRRQETYAIGATLLLSSFFPVYAANSGVGASTICEQSGATSQMAIVFSALILLLTTLLAGPLFYHLPSCVMAVIVLIVVGKQLEGVFQVPHLWKTSKWDFCIWTATFLTSVSRGIVLGLGIGMIFQLFTVVARTQWPRWTVWYSKRKNSSNVCIFEFESMLLFANGEKFVFAVQETLDKWCEEDRKSFPHIFVLDCTVMIDVDAVGLSYLVDVLKDLHGFAFVYFIKPRWFLVKILREEGVNISDHQICETIDEALEKVDNRNSL